MTRETPWTIKLWGLRFTRFQWGWDLYMHRGSVLTYSRHSGLYVSPNGTPDSATRWIWRRER